MTPRTLHRLVTLCLAAVWIGFGLLCKILGLAPRHEEIVARILGEAGSAPITLAIGGLEVLMGVWILSGVKSRLNATAQIALIGTMNLLEIWLAPDLLLWGRFNALFAAALIAVVYVNEWVLGASSRS